MFHAAIEKGQHAFVRGPGFFFLGAGGWQFVLPPSLVVVRLPQWTVVTPWDISANKRRERDFFVFSLFPWDSQKVAQVPELFSKTFPISPQIFPNSHEYKPKRWAIGEHTCSYFGTEGPKRCFYGRVPNVPKKLMMGQSIWLVQKKKKRVVSAPMN
jgi:hypothetical protein